MAKPKVQLKAKQIIPLVMADGQSSIGMIAEDGSVYTYVGTGWVKVSMEVIDDTKV